MASAWLRRLARPGIGRPLIAVLHTVSVAEATAAFAKHTAMGKA
jgi:hypothetical protein